jgi:hypothetical protein
MYTTEWGLACYFADLVCEMKEKKLANKDTTFQDIAEYSDERIALKEILVE